MKDFWIIWIGGEYVRVGEWNEWEDMVEKEVEEKVKMVFGDKKKIRGWWSTVMVFKGGMGVYV